MIEDTEETWETGEILLHITNDEFLLNEASNYLDDNPIERMSLEQCMRGYLPEDCRVAFSKVDWTAVQDEVRETLGIHTGHWSTFGTYWCDTCDSPYCEEA